MPFDVRPAVSAQIGRLAFEFNYWNPGRSEFPILLVCEEAHELSEAVLSQCGTYICLRISNPEDQDHVRKLVPEGEADPVDVLAALGRGESLILGRRHPCRCAVRYSNRILCPTATTWTFIRHGTPMRTTSTSTGSSGAGGARGDEPLVPCLSARRLRCMSMPIFLG